MYEILSLIMQGSHLLLVAYSIVKENLLLC